MTKKLLIMLCLTLLFPILSVANAQTTIQMSVDGKNLSLPNSPIVVKGTTMIPITPVLQELSLSVESNSNYITAKKEGYVITLQSGSKVANINGVSIILSEAVQVVNGTTMAPLKLLSETLGTNITSTGNAISITAKQGHSIFYNDLPITLSGKYVANKAGKDILEVNVVDFFYNPSTKTVNEYDFLSSVIGSESGSAAKYNDFVVAQTTYNGEVYLGSAVKQLEYYDDTTDNSALYANARKHYRSKEYLAQVIALIDAENAAFNAKLKKELSANHNIPLKVLSATVSYNSIGTPEVNLTVKNLTKKTIVAYRMNVRAYDDFDRRANSWATNDNLFKGISQNNSIGSGSSQTDTWDLTFYDLATQVKYVKITEVRFSDGTSWKSKS